MKKGFLGGRAPKEKRAPPQPPKPKLLKVFTEAELQLYDGRDQTKPLLLALKFRVLDVSTGADYYGSGGSYHVFAGRHARYFTRCTHKAHA